jgi:hypothetical protein
MRVLIGKVTTCVFNPFLSATFELFFNFSSASFYFDFDFDFEFDFDFYFGFDFDFSIFLFIDSPYFFFSFLFLLSALIRFLYLLFLLLLTQKFLERCEDIEEKLTKIIEKIRNPTKCVNHHHLIVNKINKFRAIVFVVHIKG